MLRKIEDISSHGMAPRKRLRYTEKRQMECVQVTEHDITLIGIRQSANRAGDTTCLIVTNYVQK